MSNSANKDFVFIRTEDAPVLPPPASQVGVWGWLWRNIFASMANFSSRGAAIQSILMGLLTFGVLWFALSQLWNFLSFALFDAVWFAPEGVTGDACRSADNSDSGIQPEGWFAACYPYVSAKWKLLVYGRYTDTEIWRVDLVYLLGGLGVGWLVAHAIPSRKVVGVGLIAFGALLGLAIVSLYGETFGARVGVHLPMLVGLMWILMPDNAPRGGVGLAMLALYPLIAFILLTGGDLEVAPSTLLGMIVLSGVLFATGAAGTRGLLGEIGAAFGGLLASLGWIVAAAAVAVFLSSDILVDLIEAAAGYTVTAREAAALDWWHAAKAPGRLAPTADEISAFAGSFGSALTPEELERLRAMRWEGSLVGASTAPESRAVWPLPTVETADWGGLLVTLVVSFAGIVFSLPLGILLAIGRRSTLPAVRILSIAFIEFWRGVPLITVLFMSSVMLPFFLPEGTDFNKLMRALIGVMFFNAAYQAEVVRGGLQAIPKGQYEGAMALGLPYWRMLNLIILPQALVLVIPGIVNTFLALFKDTTLVLIISLFDILGIVNLTLRDSEWATPVTATTGYIVAALMFFVFCFGMSRYSMAVERELRRGRSR